jgi:excisionase family DNA binding protein
MQIRKEKEVMGRVLARVSYRPAEVAVLTGISLRTVEEAIRMGTLVSKKIGRCRVITAESIKSWVSAA